LNALSPLATLERGYAVARDERGATLTSSTQFAEEQAFTLRLRDGEVDATTRAVRPLPESPR
jgi:exodeoxyribonuclease VII large subunit